MLWLLPPDRDILDAYLRRRARLHNCPTCLKSLALAAVRVETEPGRADLLTLRITCAICQALRTDSVSLSAELVNEAKADAMRRKEKLGPITDEVMVDLHNALKGWSRGLAAMAE